MMCSSSWWRTARKFSWACRARAEALLSPVLTFTSLSPNRTLMHRLPQLLGVILKHGLFFRQSYLLLFKTVSPPSIFVQVPLLPIPPSPPLLLPYSVHDQLCTLDTDTLSCPFLSFFMPTFSLHILQIRSQFISSALVLVKSSLTGCSGDQNSLWVVHFLSFEARWFFFSFFFFCFLTSSEH